MRRTAFDDTDQHFGCHYGNPGGKYHRQTIVIIAADVKSSPSMSASASMAMAAADETSRNDTDLTFTM